jgi:YVTN family beta-propeller protein
VTDDAPRPAAWHAHWRLVRTFGIVAAAIALLVPVAMSLRPPDTTASGTAPATSLTESTATSTSTTNAAPTSTSTSIAVPTSAVDDGKRSDERRLVDEFVVSNDDLQPKSIVASGTGIFVAQNMMYRHNVMVFDRAGNVLATIDDTVDLAAFGIEGGVVAQGSPVEAAFLPGTPYVYVSNYKMYGNGFTPTADDNCNRGDWDDSYVYKINTTTYEIEKVIATGSVPKFMAVSPDGSRLLVSNWCGFDVTVIDTATDTAISRIDVGRHPRGIAITQNSRAAYVAIMGEAKILKLDLQSNAVVGQVGDAGQTPRHLLLSPDDRYLYVSNNHENMVRKIDLTSGVAVGKARTGVETRSMAMADDGASLYVVNYEDGTVSKVRTSDMEILQTEQSGVHPVGITYDPATRQVWVATYAGTLRVFADR